MIYLGKIAFVLNLRAGVFLNHVQGQVVIALEEVRPELAHSFPVRNPTDDLLQWERLVSALRERF